MGSFNLELAVWEGSTSLLLAMLLCCLRALKLWGSEQAAVLLSLCSVCIPQLHGKFWFHSGAWKNRLFTVCCTSSNCHGSSSHISGQAFLASGDVLTARKELIWNVVKRKYVASIQGLASVDLHLRVSVNGENIILQLWKGEGSNKCWSLALKLTASGCILLAVLFPVEPSVHPSQAAAHSCMFWMLPCKNK